ncbi:MAG TPA: NAD(P)/FAD-dependent oxidoreductase [Acidimicrobiales bacterium]|nr:NAD(P)/FAD-dependent oxidoreductase [Acidimicrobiales bacterium]
MPVRPHVVVVGSGFGGLNAATRLARQPVDITVVDRDNYHGFWPLLYQVATAGLGADDIAHPIRSIYSEHPNVTVRLGTVTDIDLDDRVVEVDGEPSLRYDYLVLAAGSSTSDFGIPGVEEHAFALKTLPDAVRLRNHILATFEHADIDGTASRDPGSLTVVLVGGGPTGVEMAGALSELIGRNLAADFPRLDLTQARVVLVEMTDHLLPGFGRPSQESALDTLQKRGVEVCLNTRLAKVTAEGVTFEDGRSVPARTVVWTAGVKANPLASCLPGGKGKGGTVPVRPDLSLEGHPEVFVIGDLAAIRPLGRLSGGGDQLPQLAQVAIQGGRHTADNIRRVLQGKDTVPFRYRNHGIMATIGRRAAVAELPGGLKFRGTVGWLAWLGVHLVFLVGFRNRVVVMINWAWNYLTWDRAARVILDDGSRTPTGQPRA